jgi:hypothetical protein
LKILLDHNVNRRFRKQLPGHGVRTTRENGWEQLENGTLLRVAADAKFDVFLSLDKKLEYEQNLQTLPLTVIVLDSQSNALQHLAPFAPAILALLAEPTDRALYVIQPDFSVAKVTMPRSSP